MTDEDDPRPYDPEELDDDELDLDGELDEANAPSGTDASSSAHPDETGAADAEPEDTDPDEEELPDWLPRGIPTDSADDLSGPPDRDDPDLGDPNLEHER